MDNPAVITTIRLNCLFFAVRSCRRCNTVCILHWSAPFPILLSCRRPYIPAPTHSPSLSFRHSSLLYLDSPSHVHRPRISAGGSPSHSSPHASLLLYILLLSRSRHPRQLYLDSPHAYIVLASPPWLALSSLTPASLLLYTPPQLTVLGRSTRSAPCQRNAAHSGLCFSMRATTTVMSSRISP